MLHSGLIVLNPMTKNGREETAEKADEEQRRCREWLFIKDNQPKFLTKAELRGAAIRELNVSKSSFDSARIDAIEEAGQQGWYEPLRPTDALKRLNTFPVCRLHANHRITNEILLFRAYGFQYQSHKRSRSPSLAKPMMSLATVVADG
jgi:hypothetical protein